MFDSVASRATILRYLLIHANWKVVLRVCSTLGVSMHVRSWMHAGYVTDAMTIRPRPSIQF